MLVTIKLKDKSNNCISNEVPIEDLVFHQSEIEFVFPDYTDNYTDETYDSTLPYQDFLFFQDDYEVIVCVKNENK